MTKPIPDKAEVALEYPDKLYIGTFERTSRFDAHLDDAGISLSLHRSGSAEQRRSIRMHFHYELFVAILHDLAKTAAAMPPDDAEHHKALRDGALVLADALDTPVRPKDRAARQTAQSREDELDVSRLTPEEEVLLLHVME